MHPNPQSDKCNQIGAIAGGAAVLGMSAGTPMGDAVEQKRRPSPTISAFVEVRADRCFADALMHAMDGQRITRRGWNGANQYVSAQYPDSGPKMTAPYLFLKNAQDQTVPWVPSQGDLFAHDWAMLPRT